jgi:DNA-binding helix-hairpin-helix protein with protein kinase domain
VTPPADLVTTSGLRLTVGKSLGKGGEGFIYQVEGGRPFAVKLYLEGMAAERREKVRAMIADKLFERTSFVAFPIEEVTAKGVFAGFTMRQVVAAKLLHQLCTPGDRKIEFPAANFRFLVRVALNFSRAVAGINELGAVVGDINESVALIDQKGLVSIIDSDSFQYRRGSTLYRCKVGKPEYTAPELQGQSLGGIDRTINHDSFAVAVILFELLFMGRHPFAGTFKGAGEQLPISRAIQEGRFAYSPQRLLTQMEPPPHAPLLADIPMEAADAFQRTFGLPNLRPQSRPTAAQWVPILERMEKGLIECNANAAHHYSQSATSCPWCRLERGLGTILFVASYKITQTTFGVIAVLARIEKIQGPGPAPDLPSLFSAINFEPSPAAREYRNRYRGRKVAGVATAGVSAFLMLAGIGWGLLLLIPAAIIFFGEISGRGPILQQWIKAQSDWKGVADQWSMTAGAGRFDEKRAALLSTAGSYRALAAVELDTLHKLELRKRDLQLQKHLERHKLGAASIENIGDGRKMTLRSYGVESAWDVSAAKIKSVAGFGPALTTRLTDWRKSVEASFKFNPNIPTDPAEIAKVRVEIAMRRSVMETSLLNGPRDLEAIKAAALSRRGKFHEYRGIYETFRQAEADAALV